MLVDICVTGPCELLVMYNEHEWQNDEDEVTGPCELLVMYNPLLIL